MTRPPAKTTAMLGLCIGIFAAEGLAQAPTETVNMHVAAAKAAAGQDHTFLFGLLCAAPPLSPSPLTASQGSAAPSGAPDRSLWHAEPTKVFDNLYYVGMTEYGAWAVTTSEGIIVVDALFDYSVKDEIVDGLVKLGLDPRTIKYVIVTHGHVDHVGGARYLQEYFGARVVMGADDWDLVERSTHGYPTPQRDIVATDGQRITLGDETVTLYLTPGHTLGTISVLIPVTDGGKPHLAAEWGGTAFNWTSPGGRAAYITPDRPDGFWFDTYATSAQKFRDIVARTGADVLISNHTDFDGTKVKIPSLAKRKQGGPHPYVVGTTTVQRYLTVAEECAKAGRLRLASKVG